MSIVNFLKTFLLLVVITAFLSCKKSAVKSEFSGQWAGSFESQYGDYGTWNASINDNGSVTGSGVEGTINFSIGGTVDQKGGITFSSGSTSMKATFVGLLSNNNASGTWTNTSSQSIVYTGSWEGKRQ